ncbi:MAG: NnrS family protein [Hyphomicrobiales bacterium]|nr:NnrS family protein [Hyphomicrobiales bacterium]
MNSQRGAIPRLRSARGPAILAYGFRPFFLLSGFSALAIIILWLFSFEGTLELPTAFAPISWHTHEMLFGFVGAAIAGFLLTAVPNWTGRLPLNGGPLLGLVVLWLAGRMAVYYSAVIGAEVTALIDLSFFAVLFVVIVREITAGRNWRNLPIAIAVALLVVANGAFHVEAMGLAVSAEIGWRLGIAVVTLLLALIGGRIVPSFTRNWLDKHGTKTLPAPLGRFDMITLVLTLVAMVFWTIVPDVKLTSLLLLLAAGMNAVRLGRWQGYRTAAEPLVLILHVAYAWLPVGLGLLALQPWWPAVNATAGIHALTVGAMATMILAVMTRASLGHTGRSLHAGAAITAIYVLITIAALFRVGSALISGWSTALLHVSTLAWAGSFICFLVIYSPILLRPRPDGKPG